MTDARTGRLLAMVVVALGLAYFGGESMEPDAPPNAMARIEPSPDPQPSPISQTIDGQETDDGREPIDEGLTMAALADNLWPDSFPTTIDDPPRSLVINAVGDVNVDPAYIPTFLTEGYDHALSGMDGLFLDDDLTVINLECPASPLGRAEDKTFTFSCDPAALPTLRRLGVDVANQGNNHSLDYGSEAMLDSLANLEAAGIAAVGAGADARQAAEPALLRRRGRTVAVVGFGGVVPSGQWIASEDRPGMADGDDIDSMVAAVTAAAEQADIVVVTIHWGVELQSGPPADDVARAEAMIDAGADMVFGHHPHRLNGLDWYRDRPIFWSLGNFIWPRLSAEGSDTAVAQVIVDGDGSVRACLIDVTIVSHGHPELDDPAHRSCSD